MIELVSLAAGGFAGAVARYAVQTAVSRRWPTALPIGTFLVNVLGSFLLGLLAGAAVDQRLALLLGTGFMGAFTTFSTFKMESLSLFRRGKGAAALMYMALSYGLGIGAAWLGIRLS